MGSNIQNTAARMKIPSARCPPNDSPGRVINSGNNKPTMPRIRPKNRVDLNVLKMVFIAIIATFL
jgi:hypothetical protein